jgi:hypothetical protein
MPSHSSPQAALQDLRSSDPDTAARAADGLFAMGSAREIFADRQAGEALRESIARNNRTAATVLLLGYLPDSAPLLQQLVRAHGAELVKLKPWSRMVPLRVAATAALSRLGEREDRHRFLAEIPEYEDSIRIFLLDLLAYIDSPEVWHALGEYLNDTREIPEDVPSGAARRRVCDHAVDAFLARFALPVSFQQLPGGQYGAKEIEEVRQRFRQTVPR